MTWQALIDRSKSGDAFNVAQRQLIKNPNTDLAQPFAHITFVNAIAGGIIDISTDFDPSQKHYKAALEALCRALKKKYPCRRDSIKYDSNENRVFFGGMGSGETKAVITQSLAAQAGAYITQRQQQLLSRVALNESGSPEIESLARNFIATDIKHGYIKCTPCIVQEHDIIAGFTVPIRQDIGKFGSNAKEEAAFLLAQIFRHHGYQCSVTPHDTGLRLVFWGKRTANPPSQPSMAR